MSEWKVKKLSESSQCENGDCKAKATDIVYSNNLRTVIFCCEPCSDLVVDEGNPEYLDSCNNCGCRQGIN